MSDRKSWFSPFLILFVAFFCGPAAGCAGAWQRAEVYFLDWGIETRSSIAPERLRHMATVKWTFREDTAVIVRLLELDQLKPAKDQRSEDARLVIDLFGENGEHVSYYASRFELCTMDDVRKHPIDEQFRRYFQRLAQ